MYQSLLDCKLKGRPFDLVLLSDRNALEFALEHRQELFTDSPIVFCGIRNFQPEMIAGVARITGVGEALAFRETIHLALELHPDTAEIVVLGKTANGIDLASYEALRAIAPEFEDRARFIYWNDLPMQEVTSRLQQLTRGSLVFINGSVADETGHVLPFPADIRQLRKACRVPLYGFRDIYLNHGIVGGKLVNAAAEGKLAADLALRILKGEQPENLPVIPVGGNEYMFDYRQLDRFGIAVKQLPEDSQVINQPPAFYTLTKKQLWLIVAIMMFFTADLLFVLYQRRRTENALKESIAQTKLLLNSAAEGIYGLDHEGRCTFCNPAALRLLGFEQEAALLGRDLHELIHHTRADGTPYDAADCRICHAYQQSSRIHLEDEVFWRQDGTSFPVEYWSYPLVRGNQTVGAVVSFLNISERKLAEEKLKEANRELDAFVYTASHDLRTPLSVVSGYADLLREECGGKMDAEALKYLTTIEKHSAKMAGLIDDLLALAKAGSIEPPDEPVDTNEIIQDVLIGLESQINAAQVQVNIEPLPKALVPETLLCEIFENLIGNALRYATSAGDVIEVGGGRTGGKVHFHVRDHGPGIPEEEAARIFEVFYRGSTGQKVLGSGVGLATVQKIARLYNGSAWVEETPGGGATFRVEMEDR
jgi:PAS domain S-box-containing protein